LICMALFYYSLQFLKFEYMDGTVAFANIPSWVFISILPFSFMVMGLRYLLKAFLKA